MSPTEISNRTAERPQFQRHCPGCFQFKGGQASCQHCSYDEGASRSAIFLPHGITLGGQYRVGRVLGRPGGFGITYLGWDINLQQRVAIKEYLPREIATREPNSLNVSVHTGEDKRGFEFGKEQFLREARIVAKLDHPNVVRVRNFFNANATAYLVMDYYEGVSLGDYLSSVRARLEPELAIPLVKPILDGLHYVHERGLVHRDLKPHNIYLAAVGRPIVLDFGAARQAAGDRIQSLSVVLTEGYAPLEQYQRRAVQGPWTDVYGLAATLYRTLVGQAPPIALDRIGHDPMDDQGWVGIPEALVPAMKMALAVRPNDRYQTAKAFRDALNEVYPDTSTGGEDPQESNPRTVELPTTREVVQSLSRYTTAERKQNRASSEAETVNNLPEPLDLGSTVVTQEWLDKPAEASDKLSSASLAQDVPRPRIIPPPATADASIGSSSKRPLSFWLASVLTAFVLLTLIFVLFNPPEPGLEPTPAAAVATSEKSLLPDKTQAEPPAVVAAVDEPAPDPAVGLNSLPILTAVPAGLIVLSEPAGAGQSAGKLGVAIAPLSVTATEITVAEFGEFVAGSGYQNPLWQNYPCESAGGRLPEWDHPGYGQDESFPVVCVSFADATAYAAWLTKISGAHYRLPTEAEWEYLARGGSRSQYWWGERFEPRMASCQNCPPQGTTMPSAVKTYPANPFGLFETIGNVREWTCSAYGPYAEAQAKLCSATGSTRALRGGSWRQPINKLATAQRDFEDRNHRDVWTGFRVVRDNLPPSEATP